MNEVPSGSRSDAPARTVEVFAPAKLNLFLHVVGRRQDGRHELESIFAFAEVGDRLRLSPGDAFSLILSGPFADDLGGRDTDGGNNLVMKAARKLAQHAEQAAFPVRLELEKNLPVAAGMGGGSADAAAALRGLSELWGLRLPADRMHELALELGADVPACLGGAMARVTGTGEIVEPCPALQRPLDAVLVNPGVQLSTAAVFDRYRASGAAFSDRLNHWPDSGDSDILDALAGCRNDLTGAAVAETPIIADVLGELEQQQDCRLARMSGSGATCFGLYDDRGAAERAAARLGSDHPDWWVTAATLQ